MTAFAVCGAVRLKDIEIRSEVERPCFVWNSGVHAEELQLAKLTSEATMTSPLG